MMFSPQLISQTLRGSLLVHAEGTPGDDPEVSVRDYGQQAVICEVTPEQPHAQRAWERFTPDGPLALLPDELSGGCQAAAPAACRVWRRTPAWWSCTRSL